jgi:hypothetical protein
MSLEMIMKRFAKNWRVKLGARLWRLSLAQLQADELGCATRGAREDCSILSGLLVRFSGFVYCLDAVEESRIQA